jgi:beta-lactamase superfamily II metal-dependent hydrolase
MKRLATVLVSTLALAAAGPAAQSRDTKPLDIYVVDTEGGKATLFVTPSGETVLVDSGNPGGRDTGRIMEVFTQAGVTKIDHLISTHYHVDHIGGLPELAGRIPIGHFVDHGPSAEAKEQVQGFQAAYAELRAKAKHTVVKPGDRIPVAGLDWRIVTSDGKVLRAPLPGGGRPNPACAQAQRAADPANPDDNAHSVGSVITFGQFRAIDLGDLLAGKEFDLMCPNNPVGVVDLYLVTHHGLAASGSQVLLQGVRPRVAVMQNGTRKGGSVQAYQIMRSTPGLEDIWQLHWSYNGAIEHNPAGVFIANVDDAATIASVLTAPPPGRRGGGAGRQGPPAAPASAPAQPGSAPPGPGQTTAVQSPSPGQPPAGAGGGRGGGRGAAAAAAAHTPAYYIRISARSDGSFTVTNTRNGYSRTYPRRTR